MEHEVSKVKHIKNKLGKKSNLIIALAAVVVILVVVAVINFGGAKLGFSKNVSPDEAKAKAEDFINKNLVAAGTTATVTEVADYDKSLYKLKVKVGDNEIESFISKDGKQFFPQAMDIEKLSDSANVNASSDTSASTPVTPTDITKSDKPKVELFVMSHCPYGTQIEKGIVPVAKALGNKIDFEIKFVNYIMHGETELQDNINQYCIGSGQADKYNDFLDCFLKSGDSASCVSSTGINKSKLDSCYKATDKKFSLTSDFNDKSKYKGSFPTFNLHDSENNKYGVQGSPTLVINGKQVESNRDSASLLTTICAAFNKTPDECSTKLDSASPAPGFGTGTDSSGSAANCAPSN